MFIDIDIFIMSN